MEDLYQKERRQRYDVRAKTQDGREIWVSALATRIEFQGRVAVLLSLKDITETKQAQEALRQSEELYATMANSAQVGIYIVQDGKFVFVNPQFQQDTGFSADELLGTDSLGIVHPEDRETVRENAARMLKGELISPYEYRAIDRSGRTRVVVERVAPIRHRGKLASMGCYIDITERKQMEEMLRKSEEKLRTYLESSPDLICVIDLKGTVLYINRAAERITGYSSEELLGKRFLELPILPPEYLSRPPKLLELNQSGEPAEPSELELVRKNGSRIFIEISYLPIGSRTEGGKTEIIGIARDVTERKQIEKALRQSEERFRNVLDNSLDMIYSMNLQTGKYEYVSPSLKEMLGYSLEEFSALGSDELTSLVHPDDAEELQQNIIDLITRGENRAVSAEYQGQTQGVGLPLGK